MAKDISARLLQFPMARRLLFTVGVLLVYRIGCQIPLPGLNQDTLARLNGVLSVERVSLFALGVTPFLSALLIIEFVKLLIPPLANWETAQPNNARRLGLLVYFAGLVMAGLQARGVAHALYGISGLIDEPGWETVIAITMVAGTALLGWFAGQITALGVGNGFWLLLITPTLVKLPGAAWGSIELVQRGAVTPAAFTSGVLFLLAATAAVAVVARADGANAEHRMSGAAFVGVWPPLLASTVAAFVGAFFSFTPGQPFHLILLAVLIIAFNGLQRAGAAPGTSRPVWTIALVQFLVCGGGDLLAHHMTLPFAINGSWLIIVVTTAMNCLRSKPQT
jgi:preprotein translocase subunit SecY